jgi:hypothetical protein
MKWYYTAQASGVLDLPAEKLRDLARSGMFKVGFHIRDVSGPNSKRPTWQFHIERCEKLLNTPPEERQCYPR